MFIDSKNYDFCAQLESNWQVIREECLRLAQDQYDPWVQREMYGEGWSVFGLYFYAKRIEGAAAQCPDTCALLAQIPGLLSAGFSRLAAHTHIKPHVGWDKSFYRLHLGLDVPQGCRFRVATQTRDWRNGQCLVFDDTQEHEAWNDSPASRTVLLLDFLKPGAQAPQIENMPQEVGRYARSLFADE